MDLLTNAIQSIQSGVEDYQEGSPARLLSAVRNIHAGILLLFKEALRRESPAGTNDVLMMAKIVPIRDSRGIVFVGDGKKTADVQQIRERFEGVGINADWKRFDRVNDVRNDVEHRYPRVDQKALQGLISDSFILVRDFIKDELQDDPLSLLDEETWQAMLEVAEVYQKEPDECHALVKAAKWRLAAIREGVLNLTCPTCGSALLKLVEDSYGEYSLQCASCGEEQSPTDYVPDALKFGLRHEAYVAMDDGGDPPIVRCPECNEESFLPEQWVCALCEAEPDRSCARCGMAIPPEELSCAPFCSYCEHMMNNED